MLVLKVLINNFFKSFKIIILKMKLIKELTKPLIYLYVLCVYLIVNNAQLDQFAFYVIKVIIN